MSTESKPNIINEHDHDDKDDKEIAQINDQITPIAKGTTMYYCNEETEKAAMVNNLLLTVNDNNIIQNTTITNQSPKTKTINVINNHNHNQNQNNKNEIQNENENEDENVNESRRRNDDDDEDDPKPSPALPSNQHGASAAAKAHVNCEVIEEVTTFVGNKPLANLSKANIQIENYYFDIAPIKAAAPPRKACIDEMQHNAVQDAQDAHDALQQQQQYMQQATNYNEAIVAKVAINSTAPAVVAICDDKANADMIAIDDDDGGGGGGNVNAESEADADAAAADIIEAAVEAKGVTEANKHIFLSPKPKYNKRNNKSVSSKSTSYKTCNNITSIKNADHMEDVFERLDKKHRGRSFESGNGGGGSGLLTIGMPSVVIDASVDVGVGGLNCKEDDYTDEALSNAASANIKTSLSMTSLSPDEKRESRDVIKEKLKMERPYNSLKKSAFGQRTNNNITQKRYSWESGNSHSSSSLYSSTTLGLGSCKDDLWSAIQTNYNYIMDTNLLDSCKEARYEIEGATNVLESPIKCYSKMLDETNRSEDFCGDLNELRRWLVDMENKLKNAPTVSEATFFNVNVLQQRLTEYSVLYHEIVSHARVVSACIRVATERERKQQQQQQQQLLELNQQSLNNCKSSSFAEKNNSSLSSTDETSTSTITIATTSLGSVTSSSSLGDGLNSQSISSSGIGTSLESKSPLTSPLPQPTPSTLSLEESSAPTASSSLKSFVATSQTASVSTKKNSSNTNNNCHNNISGSGGSTSNSGTCSEGNFDQLQNRYHLLYLKALEVQLCLDGLLTKRSAELNDETYEDIDDVESDEVDICSSGATEDDLDHVISDLDSDHQSIHSEDKLEYHQNLPNKSNSSKIATAQFDCTDSKVLKSAEASSDDDEGWLYSSLTPTQKLHQQLQLQQQHQHHPQSQPHPIFNQQATASPAALAASECLNNSKSKIISTVIVDGIQSSTVSSSTATKVAKATVSAIQEATTAVARVTTTTTCTSTRKIQAQKAIIEASNHQAEPQQSICCSSSSASGRSTSDSDKENKEKGSSSDATRISTTTASHHHRMVSLNSFQTTAVHSYNQELLHQTEAEAQAEEESDEHFEEHQLHLQRGEEQKQLSITAKSSLSSSSALSNNAVMSSSTTSTASSSQLSNCSSTKSCSSTSDLQSEATTTAKYLLQNQNQKQKQKQKQQQQQQMVHCHSSNCHQQHQKHFEATEMNTRKNLSADLLQQSNNNIYSSQVQNSSTTVAAAASNNYSTNVLAANGNNNNSNIVTSPRSSNNNNNDNKTNHIINSSNSNSSNCYTILHNNNIEPQPIDFKKKKAKNVPPQNNHNNHHHNHHYNYHQPNHNHSPHQYPPQSKAAAVDFFNTTESTDSDDNNFKYTTSSNGHKLKNIQICSFPRGSADYNNGNLKPISDSSSKLPVHHQHATALNKSLPPRSPGKSIKPRRCSTTLSTAATTKSKVSQESIKQLVLEAEHLVRDEVMKTPTKSKHTTIKISSTVKKREINMSGPIKQRVQEWLEHQPSSPSDLNSKTYELILNNVNDIVANTTDDCEASGEASETDSIPQTVSETSEGFSDSIATCMQTSTNSYGNSTERIGGSAEPVGANNTLHGSSNQSLNIKVVKRQQNSRRKAERPWSVSCLSQLTTEAIQEGVKESSASQVQSGLASHSISESALDSLSPKGNRPRVSSSSAVASASNVRKYDSKGSLKKRRTRKKKLSSAGKRTDSGSDKKEELPKSTQSLLKKSSCESMTAQQMQEITNGLHMTRRSSHTPSSPSDQNVGSSLNLDQKQTPLQGESEEEQQLMEPNFIVGSYTTSYMTNEARLGSLAALATYVYDEEQQGETGTEDHHSNFSETASWDNYVDKYSDVSETFDSDGLRRLMEPCDDYRNFIDSLSDSCSMLSAANNMDSLSPPRMDSLQQNEAKIITQDNIVSSVDHARRRRALELEYERRRKTLEVRRKSCQDVVENPRTHQTPNHQQQQQRNSISNACLPSSSTSTVTPKNTVEKASKQAHKIEYSGRKLEFGMSHSSQSLRRTSESDTSTRRRKTADERRRSSRNLEKCIKLIPATTSSSNSDDSDDEKEMRNLLQQSRDRLDDTKALKIRCHLLRPEDYTEIINTCRDNIRCLESVLRGPPGSVLSTHCVTQIKGELAICHVQVECKCAPITRFIARTIDFILDVSNLLEHFTLYRFFLKTLRSLYALVKQPLGHIERVINSFKRIL